MARGWTRKQAADAAGLSFGLYHKLERGERRMSAEYIVKIADAFGIEANDLTDKFRTRPANVPAKAVSAVPAVPATVPILGYSGDIDDTIAWSNFGPAPAPVGATATTAAVEIRGGFLRRVAGDGWFLYFEDLRQPVNESTLGEMSVVATAAGDVLLRAPLPGSRPGHFHLEAAGAPTMYDVEITWAAVVLSIIPGKVAQRMLAGETFDTQSAPFKASQAPDNE